MSQQPTLQSLFERPMTLPDPDAQGRLARLVGMDDKIKRLANVLGVLINPAGLRKWQDQHHADAGNLLDAVIRRPPLVVLSGDVGSGKTELAETIGDKVARHTKHNAQREKALRSGHRVIAKSRFVRLDGIEDVIQRLLG